MLNKVILIVICFLCIVHANAQQHTATNLLNSVIKLTDSLKNDNSIKDPCKKNISTFSRSLPAPGQLPADTKKIKALIQACTRLTNSFKEVNSKACSNQKTSNLLHLTAQFTESLQALDVPAADSSLVNKSVATAKTNDSNLIVNQAQNDTAVQSSIQKETSATMQQPGDAFTQQLNALHSQNIALLIAVMLLVLLNLVGIYLYAKTNKKFILQFASLSHSYKLLETSNAMEPAKTNPLPAASVAGPIEEKPAPVVVQANENIAAVPDAEAYVVCEVMMTAGPRKKPMSDPNSDIDLGEDVCGFIAGAGGAFIWLLDGTSDDYPLRNPATNREYFSARLLAQCIGDRLRNKFSDVQQHSLATMLQQSIEEVKMSWLQIINALPDEEKQILKNNIEDKNFPHCSTTALIAWLQKNGNLTAYRVGDSKMLLFSTTNGEQREFVETSFADKNVNGVDRIFFRLELTDDKAFDIVSNNNLEHDTAEVSNIATMICFSDGIGIETEQTLTQQYKTDPVKAKREIMYEVQGTSDDKSICFVELKK